NHGEPSFAWGLGRRAPLRACCPKCQIDGVWPGEKPSRARMPSGRDRYESLLGGGDHVRKQEGDLPRLVAAPKLGLVAEMHVLRVPNDATGQRVVGLWARGIEVDHETLRGPRPVVELRRNIEARREREIGRVDREIVSVSREPARKNRITD